MAEYESEALGVKFTLPDKLTVFQQLAWRGRTAVGEGGVFIRMWNGAVELIQDWECELIPDPKKLDMNAEEDGAITDIVQFVANSTASHITALGLVPKNA